MKKIFPLALLAICAVPFLAAEDGWELALGAGLFVSPVYEGSGDTFVSPFPRVDVSYNTGGLYVSASLLDGLGVRYLHGASGILGSISIAPGSERNSLGYTPLMTEVEHSDRTLRLLEDTPTARSPFSADLALGAVTPVGLVGVTMGYRPTEVETTYQAFVGSVFYMIELPLTERLSLSALADLEAMDARYAEAWYGLEQDTPALKAFKAEAGLRAARLAVEASVMILDRVGVSLLAEELVLLGDAADSPYTEQRCQTRAALQAFYKF